MTKIVKLGELIKPAALRRAGAEDFPVLSMTMHEGLVDQSKKFKKRVASSDTSGYRVVRRGQLVVGFPIDEAVLSFQRLYDEAIVSPAYGIWDLTSGAKTDRAYLERFLRSPRAITYYVSKLRGSTARRRSLPRDVFLAMPVPLPPIEEQRRIAVSLDAADALRAKRRQAIAKLDTLTQAIFIHMFGGAAKSRCLDDLAEFKYGTSEKSASAGLPTLRIPNVVGGEVSYYDMKRVPVDAHEVKRLALDDGDLLFVRSNGNPDAVGRCAAFVRSDALAAGYEGPVIYASYLIRARLTGDLDPIFASVFLNGARGRRQLRDRAKTSAGQYNINTKGLGSIEIPDVTPSAQHDFARRIAAVHQHFRTLERSLQSLDTLFASLQQRAFRGEL